MASDKPSADFEREIRMVPAYDKRAEGYGLHGVDMVMVLKGPSCAVEAVIMLGWHWLPQVMERWPGRPTGMVTVHSPVPLSGVETTSTESCLYTGGPCYSDASGLYLDTVIEAIAREGHEGGWRALREFGEQHLEGFRV